MRHFDLELVRVTEAAAIAGSRFIGSGDKEGADKAASKAMRERLNQLDDFAAKVVIGEGKKDKSYGLFAGEVVGKLAQRAQRENIPLYELAVDPIDGTRPTITSGPEAMSVIAIAGAHCLFETSEFYMNKLAYGPHIAHVAGLKLTDPLKRTIQTVSEVTGKHVNQIVVCILDRPRHTSMIAELRKIGVRIKLIQDCDISGAIATCLPESGIDLLCGSGGAPEGVITAVAMKCLRGGFQAQVVDTNCKVVDPRILWLKDLARGPCAFSATGVTDGSLLKGVRYTPRGAVTHSVFMRSESGTIRWLAVHHG